MARFLFYDDKIINILLQNEKPSGGAAVQAFNWINGLKDSGQDIYILTNSNTESTLKNDCKNLNIIPLYNNNKGIRWIRWAYYRFPYIYKKLKTVKPDYLYQGVPGWTSCFIGVICQVLNIKYILRISNDYLLDDRIYHNYSKTHRIFQQIGFKLSTYILCQNEYQLSIIKREFPNKKFLKIPNPIQLTSEHKPSGSSKKNYIAWLGLYQYQKNLKLLYLIAKQLPHEQFHVAGKESSKCDDETFEYLEKLKELENVSFVGFLERKDIIPFLSNAKFLLNTSHYEGFSNTFLESMSVGTPILTSDKVNPDSIISRYGLGIVYKDDIELREQLINLTREQYELLTDNVLNYVSNNHENKLLARRLLDFLSVN